MTQAQVLATIRSSPGIGIRALMQRMNLGHAALRDMIEALVKEEKVVAVMDGRRRRLFLPQPGIAEFWQQILVLRDERLVALYHVLASQPAWRQRDVVRRARELWNWHPNTTRDRISKLEAAGMVARESIRSREQSPCLLVKPLKRSLQQVWRLGNGNS